MVKYLAEGIAHRLRGVQGVLSGRAHTGVLMVTYYCGLLVKHQYFKLY